MKNFIAMLEGAHGGYKGIETKNPKNSCSSK